MNREWGHQENSKEQFQGEPDAELRNLLSRTRRNAGREILGPLRLADARESYGARDESVARRTDRSLAWRCACIRAASPRDFRAARGISGAGLRPFAPAAKIGARCSEFSYFEPILELQFGCNDPVHCSANCATRSLLSRTVPSAGAPSREDRPKGRLTT